jgi:ribosomal protein L7/L12
MNDFEENSSGNDGSGSIDDAISKLFDCCPAVGDMVVCDECHAEYIILPSVEDTQDCYPRCPHCSRLAERTKLSRGQLEKVKLQIGWKTACRTAREWWTALESKHSTRLECVLKFANLLAAKKATIDEFYKAYLRSGAINIPANLLFLEFLRERALEVSPTADKKDSQSYPQLPKVILIGMPANAENGTPITLMSYGSSKIGVIKVVKRFSQLTLREIKDLVESAPTIIGCCASIADAQIVVDQINASGGHAYVCEGD